MNKSKLEISSLFRSAVTCAVNDQSISAHLSDTEMTKADLIQFGGLGVAMTSNVVKLLAAVWEVTPAEAWEIIVQIGVEQGLPGMEIG
jgi:hypothetical protein